MVVLIIEGLPVILRNRSTHRHSSTLVVNKVRPQLYYRNFLQVKACLQNKWPVRKLKQLGMVHLQVIFALLLNNTA